MHRRLEMLGMRKVLKTGCLHFSLPLSPRLSLQRVNPDCPGFLFRPRHQACMLNNVQLSACHSPRNLAEVLLKYF